MATFHREAADCLAVLRQQQQVRSGSLSSAESNFVKVTATTFTAASDGRRSFHTALHPLTNQQALVRSKMASDDPRFLRQNPVGRNGGFVVLIW